MKAKIKLHIENQSGWSDKKPEPQDIELALGVDEFVRLSDYGSPTGSIAIHELDEHTLKIRVNGLISGEAKGETLDISTNKLGTVYAITLGKSITLHTSGVTDAGCACEISFVGALA